MTKTHDKDHRPAAYDDSKEHTTVAHENSTPDTGHQHHVTTQPKPWERLYYWALHNKKISIPVAAGLLVVILAAIPYTRYAAAGLVVTQSVPVVVLDSQTGQPVASATVAIGGKTAETNAEGLASVKTKVGYAQLTVSKKYYQSQSRQTLIPLRGFDDPLQVKIKAEGRPVPVSVLNAISKQPVADVIVVAEGTESKTDKDGKALLVIPADRKNVEVKLSAKGFLDATNTLTATAAEDKSNIFSLVPSGKVYFLSNASGKVDVVKSNLDGSGRETVLAGTGKEDYYGNILVASRDWKYLALQSKRDGGEYSKIFLIETESGKTSVMDEGQASFSLHGWSNDRFIYSVERHQIAAWQSKKFALKSFHAPSKKITTLEENTADGSRFGYYNEYFQAVYVIDKEVVFIKNWQISCCSNPSSPKQATINRVQADGSQRKTVQAYDALTISSRAATFGEIRLFIDGSGTGNRTDSYKDGKIVPVNNPPDDFYEPNQPRYYVSPSGDRTVWSKVSDGKNTFYVGDNEGKNGQEIGRSENHSIYGWLTDQYILLSRRNSELYIMSVDSLKDMSDIPKISDYYTSEYYQQGFGYGYGG